MARAETMVQLTEELREALDAEAARRGVSRSAIVREALTAYLADSREAAISRAIVDGYRRIPPATPDGWGELEAASDQATRETLQRLEEDERRAGHAPW